MGLLLENRYKVVRIYKNKYMAFKTEKEFNGNYSKVYITEEIVDILNILYNSHMGNNEYAVCLDGNIKDDDYYITGIEHTKIFDTNETFVNHASCSAMGYIGGLHNHYSALCEPSEVDSESNEKSYKINKKFISVIQCDESTFGIYNINRQNSSLTWETIKSS